MPTKGERSGTKTNLSLNLPFFLQELRGEIERESQTFLNLNAVGKKILAEQKHLGQVDAESLDRKLEELNHRWNYLRAKNVAVKARLEKSGLDSGLGGLGSANSSNSASAATTVSDLAVLTQSLRELSDWADVMRSKLDAMGPIGGDELSIKKQQASSRYALLWNKKMMIDATLLSLCRRKRANLVRASKRNAT